jgi:hypothetical protein
LNGGAKCKTINADDPSVKPLLGLQSSYFAQFAAELTSPEVKALKAQIAAMEADREKERKAAATAQFSADVVGGKARGEAAFTELSRRGAASPHEKAGLVGEYTQAVLDDLIDRQSGKSPEVHFSVDGGAYQTGSREDAVKARWKARPESVLLKELIRDGKDGAAEFAVLPEIQTPNPDGVNQEQLKIARSSTPEGRALLNKTAAK